MKFLTVSLFISVTLLIGCATHHTSGKVYRGSYFHNFETSSFTPAGSDESWCVNAAEMTKAQLPASRAGTADVVVRGDLSPKGNYCNLGAYKYVLKVYEVLEATNMKSSD